MFETIVDDFENDVCNTDECINTFTNVLFDISNESFGCKMYARKNSASIKDKYLGIMTNVNAINLNSTRVNKHSNLMTMI